MYCKRGLSLRPPLVWVSAAPPLRPPSEALALGPACNPCTTHSHSCAGVAELSECLPLRLRCTWLAVRPESDSLNRWLASYGPIFIGVVFNIALYGIMITQTYLYFNVYRR